MAHLSAFVLAAAAAATQAFGQVLPPDAVGAAPAAPEGWYGNALQVPPDAEVNPELISGPSLTVAPRGETQPCRTVFGYLPYWESTDNIRWDHLTHLAAFSIGVNAQGQVTETRGWPWTSVVNTAHAHNVKVVVVVTLFDPNAVLALVSNPARRQTFYANIYQQVVAGNADGVNIDFEGAATNGWASYMPVFLTEMRDYLDDRRPGMHISIATPPVNWGSRWDLPAVADACDAVFIMGYNYYGSWSTTSGPTAPLTGGSINLTNTIDTQYAGVDRSKIVLGLPYYGDKWQTASPAAYATVVDWMNSPRVRDAGIVTQGGTQWDPNSQSPWYRWEEGGQWHQVWLDNAASINLKWDLVESRGLQGGGMWALGYDGSLSNYWDVIHQRFIESCVPACPADRTEDEAVDVFDLLAYLDGWFASNAAAEMTGDEPATIDVFDLLAYLDLWFAGC